MQNTPLIVEIVGLAGAGKTTLARHLCQRNKNIMIGPELELRKIEHIPIFAAQIYSLLPVLFQRSQSGRWFTWDEIKTMTYLNGWPDVLSQQWIDQNSVILLDHGPIFKMATLNAFGPEKLKIQGAEKWWNQMLKQWANTLDMIIWLDAPDTVLGERINNRVQKHAVKGKSRKEAVRFLELYRESFEQILNSLKVHKGPSVFQIDTSSNPIERVMSEVLNIINTQPSKASN